MKIDVPLNFEGIIGYSGLFEKHYRALNSLEGEKLRVLLPNGKVYYRFYPVFYWKEVETPDNFAFRVTNQQTYWVSPSKIQKLSLIEEKNSDFSVSLGKIQTKFLKSSFRAFQFYDLGEKIIYQATGQCWTPIRLIDQEINPSLVLVECFSGVCSTQKTQKIQETQKTLGTQETLGTIGTQKIQSTKEVPGTQKIQETIGTQKIQEIQETQEIQATQSVSGNNVWNITPNQKQLQPILDQIFTQCHPGDEIIIAQGKYDEQIIVPKSVSNIKLVARKVIIQPSKVTNYPAMLTVFGKEISIEGFHFDGNIIPENSSIIGILFDNATGQIFNNSFNNVPGPNIQLNSSSVNIFRNQLYFTKLDGIVFNSFSSGFIINNEIQGFGAKSSNRQVGISISPNSSANIKYNNIWDYLQNISEEFSIAIQIQNQSPDQVQLESNFCYFNGIGIQIPLSWQHGIEDLQFQNQLLRNFIPFDFLS